MSMWVIVEEFSSRIEADIARSVLESAGIVTQIRADDQGGMRPSLAFVGGVQLMVMQKDVDEAKKLLNMQ